MKRSDEEFEEQKTFVEYLERRKLKFTAFPQNTWTPSFNQIRRSKASGVRKGFPDLIILIPVDESKNIIAFIEMKKKKGGVVSPEQRDWLKELRKVSGCNAAVCYGCDEAISFVEHLLMTKTKKKED